MHRTLQQSMFRDIILPIIYHFSHPKFGYDDRNSSAKPLCTLNNQ